MIYYTPRMEGTNSIHSTLRYFIIPEDIYRCFILDFVKEVAKFLAAKNQAQ